MRVQAGMYNDSALVSGPYSGKCELKLLNDLNPRGCRHLNPVHQVGVRDPLKFFLTSSFWKVRSVVGHSKAKAPNHLPYNSYDLFCLLVCLAPN